MLKKPHISWIAKRDLHYHRPFKTLNIFYLEIRSTNHPCHEDISQWGSFYTTQALTEKWFYFILKLFHFPLKKYKRRVGYESATSSPMKSLVTESSHWKPLFIFTKVFKQHVGAALYKPLSSTNNIITVLKWIIKDITK